MELSSVIDLLVYGILLLVTLNLSYWYQRAQTKRSGQKRP